MVRKVFWEDPYRRQIKAQVVTVSGDVVTLDATVAFAYPGGQVFDTGIIGGFPIQNAVYQDREIRYTLSVVHTLKPGDSVSVSIDWERRYAIMKLHFAAELLIVALAGRYGRRQITRADILPDKAVLDFVWDGNISATFPFLEDELRKLIAQDLNITSDWLDPDAEKRFWEIPGVAKVPCGGTHLKRTGEIGGVSFARQHNGDGNERIEITLKDAR
jgi:Ser-tRNA(Ala) deacylase AlaX